MNNFNQNNNYNRNNPNVNSNYNANNFIANNPNVNSNYNANNPNVNNSYNANNFNANNPNVNNSYNANNYNANNFNMDNSSPNSNPLTKQEGLYCEYVFLEQAKSINLGLGITYVFMLAFATLILIAAFCTGTDPGLGIFMTIFMVLFFVFIGGVMFWKCNTYKNMYKDLKKGNYRFVRTTLIQPQRATRDVYTINSNDVPVRRKRHSYFFKCAGFPDFSVQPLSMDLWNASRPGMPVTVMTFKSMRMSYGIILDQAFDQKVLEWDAKRRKRS